jgi:hypothetical protein
MGVILLRVIKQSHRGREFGYTLAKDGFVMSNIRDFTASNGFKLISDNSREPSIDLYNKRFFVRGDVGTEDNKVALIYNNSEGQHFLRGLRLAIREYNQGACKKLKINKFSYKSRLYL